MKGFFYRRAVDLKEFGERHHSKWLICMGFKMREWALRGKAK
jgi:hypothetical protein